MKHGYRIALVDDHALIRTGLKNLLALNDFDVVLDAENGADMIEKLKLIKKPNFPQIFIIDIKMPVMDGFETVVWLNNNYPEAKVMVLTMQNDPAVVLRMLKLNIKSYLMKDIEADEFVKAINTVQDNNFYFSNEITSILVSSHQKVHQSTTNETQINNLTEREIQFLKLACTELTYAEIAKDMNLSTRTVDGYRDSVFEKLNVKSRIGLAIVAIRLKLISVNE